MSQMSPVEEVERLLLQLATAIDRIGAKLHLLEARKQSFEERCTGALGDWDEIRSFWNEARVHIWSLEHDILTTQRALLHAQDIRRAVLPLLRLHLPSLSNEAHIAAAKPRPTPESIPAEQLMEEAMETTARAIRLFADTHNLDLEALTALLVGKLHPPASEPHDD